MSTVIPPALVIMPQKWIDKYEPLPEGWLKTHAPALIERIPQLPTWITEICLHVGVSEKMIPVRIELEQGALSYRWNGTTTSYEGGTTGDETKLKYFCGVDKTESCPRPNGWFGPRQQMLGYVLRYKYWYRGINPSSPNWKNWLGLSEDPKFKPGIPVTRSGKTITPANQISADCLRYTSSMEAQFRLAALCRDWFPEDFDHKMGKVVVTCLHGGKSTVGTVERFDEKYLVVRETAEVHVKIPYYLIDTIERK